MAQKYGRSKDLWNRMFECDTRLKDLQKGRPVGTLVTLVEWHMKETPGRVLTLAIGRQLEICTKKVR